MEQTLYSWSDASSYGFSVIEAIDLKMDRYQIIVLLHWIMDQAFHILFHLSEENRWENETIAK